MQCNGPEWEQGRRLPVMNAVETSEGNDTINGYSGTVRNVYIEVTGNK